VPVKDPKELIALAYHDEPVPVTLGVGGAKSDISGEKDRRRGFWDPRMQFGLRTLPQVGEDGKRVDWKRLTYAGQLQGRPTTPRGDTNNACIRVDGAEFLFGESPFRMDDGKNEGTVTGHWKGPFKTTLGKDEKGRQRQGAKSVWVLDDKKIEITQHVEVIVGQSGDLDTCLIQYRLENQDSQKHSVGFRFLLDTFIGDNDGVPFLIPGQERLINDSFEFAKPEEVPDFIQARETEDLAKPGTVAQVGLKLEGFEVPSRVTLGAYPDVDLAKYPGGERAAQEKTMWEVPVLSIQTLKLKERKSADSCVVIYWNEKDLEPGKSRTVAFTYGLGYLAAKQGEGKLALTVGGPLTVGSENTVTAYVVNPTPKQKVTLKLPDGFDFVEGEETRDVPPLPANAASKASPVTWKIRAPNKRGTYELKAETNNGLKQSQDVTIRPKRLFGG
jgi:hypothetical protein